MWYLLYDTHDHTYACFKADFNDLITHQLATSNTGYGWDTSLANLKVVRGFSATLNLTYIVSARASRYTILVSFESSDPTDYLVANHPEFYI